MHITLTQDVAQMFEHAQNFSADREQTRQVQDVSRGVKMYVEVITKVVCAKDDITGVVRRCQSSLYVVFKTV